MTLNQRAKKIYTNFNMPLSYRINDTRERLVNCKNVISNQGRLENRNGFSKYNSSVIGGGGNILSLSFFKDVDSTRYVFAKEGASIYSVSSTSAHTCVNNS